MHPSSVVQCLSCAVPFDSPRGHHTCVLVSRPERVKKCNTSLILHYPDLKCKSEVMSCIEMRGKEKDKESNHHSGFNPRRTSAVSGLAVCCFGPFCALVGRSVLLWPTICFVGQPLVALARSGAPCSVCRGDTHVPCLVERVLAGLVAQLQGTNGQSVT